MSRIYYDTETDGLLHTVSRVWCCATIDVDTLEKRLWLEPEMEECLKYLYEAEELIGHNIVGYDQRVLLKVLKWGPRPGTKITDTLVLAKLKHTNIKDTDVKLLKAGMPTKLYGRHSLKAWGWRVAHASGDSTALKADYGGGWSQYTQEMGDYCLQDAVAGVGLWRYLTDDGGVPEVPFDLSPDLSTLPP